MRVLAGRYKLGDRHGGGGMGSVYTAEDSRLGRQVAVKIMQEHLATDPRFVERFRREARSAASLSHPNIAGVYDYGEDDGEEFIVMELVEGRDLAHLLREEGPLAVERATAIASQIAAALGHAHAAGVVHRDVKPGNVLIGEDDHVKVTDFGIARATGDSTLTASGVIMGTVHYISPEQAAGTAARPESDVYSLGIILYEMLTGSVPFTASSAVGVAMRHLDDEVPAPSALEPSVPSEVDEIVRVATAKAPEQRFPTGTEMEAALRTGTTAPLTSPGTAVPPASPAGGDVPQSLIGSWDPARVGRTALAVLAGLAVLALTLALIRVSQGSNPQPAGGAVRQEPAATETDQTSAPEPSPEAPEEEATQEATGVEIPSGMIGDNYHRWQIVLEREGLDVELNEVASEESRFTILAADPPEGSVVEPGTTVTLTISTGERSDEDDKGEEDD